MFSIWVSSRRAKSLGCTHRARFMGIIPGFLAPSDGTWVSRSDLLNPIEDILCFIWVNIRLMRGEDPDFMWWVGQEIGGDAA